MNKNRELISIRPNFKSPFWIWHDKDKKEWQDIKEKLQNGMGYLQYLKKLKKLNYMKNRFKGELY